MLHTLIYIARAQAALLMQKSQELTLVDRIKSVFELNFGDVLEKAKNVDPDRQYLFFLKVCAWQICIVSMSI
jgi:hypothetical protein